MSAVKERLAPVALLLCIGFWVAWSILDRNPITLKPIGIIGDVPGGTGVVSYIGHQNKICDGIVHRWLVDVNGHRHPLPDAAVFRDDSKINAPVTFDHDFPIPPKIPPGHALYHAQSVRWCNFWQWAFWPVTATYESEFVINTP